jgi:hypothetical protein
MPLQSGARLGPYEVLAPIGAGGMGEVYRAKDTRLDRTVAVKVLPALLGKWVAYQTSESGQFEVWVAAFPAFDNRRRISARGGGQSFWRRDGKELFYLTVDGKMMSVAVIADPAQPGGIDVRAPVELFQSPIPQPLLTVDQYSVTADGQRFLFMKPHRDLGTTSSPITVVVNWTTGIPTR